jgi:hypothetical protein
LGKILALIYFLNVTGIVKWARDGKARQAASDELETSYQLFPEENCEIVIAQLSADMALAKQAVEQAYYQFDAARDNDEKDAAYENQQVQMIDIIMTVVAATSVVGAQLDIPEPEVMNGNVVEIVDNIYQRGDLSWFSETNYLQENWVNIMDRAELLWTWQAKGKGKGKGMNSAE